MQKQICMHVLGSVGAVSRRHIRAALILLHSAGTMEKGLAPVGCASFRRYWLRLGPYRFSPELYNFEFHGKDTCCLFHRFTPTSYRWDILFETKSHRKIGKCLTQPCENVVRCSWTTDTAREVKVWAVGAKNLAESHHSQTHKPIPSPNLTLKLRSMLRRNNLGHKQEPLWPAG